MKRLMTILVLIVFVFFQTSCGDKSSKPISGESLNKKIGNLEIAQNNFPNKMNWEDAQKACADLGEGWRLPTKEELNVMFLNRAEIGDFAGAYWTSTEDNNNQSWAQHFDKDLKNGYFSKNWELFLSKQEKKNMRELDLSQFELSKLDLSKMIYQTPFEASHGLKHVLTQNEKEYLQEVGIDQSRYLRWLHAKTPEERAERQVEEARPDGMSASNLEPIAPVQEMTAPIDDSKPYDYFQMKLRGVVDGDIWKISTDITNYNKTQGKPPVDLNMPNREEAWEKYGKDVFKGDRTLFDSQFDNTTKKLVEFNDNVKKDLYFAYNDADIVEDPRAAFATTQGVDNSKPGLLNTSPDLGYSMQFIAVKNYECHVRAVRQE